MLERISLLAPLFFVLSGLMIAWDILLAGRISQLRRAPKRFAILSALCGLLLPPAAIIAFAAYSMVYGRALQPVAWVWPVTTLLFLAQALIATSRGLVTWMLGVPIILYDLVIAAAAISRYAVTRGGEPPDLVMGLAAAEANALGVIFGPAALWKSYVTIPLLAPALPAHWRTTAFARAVLGAVAMIATTFVLVEVPDGLAAVRSYSSLERERLQERPSGDFAVGVKIFPDLGALPSALAIHSDTAIARAIEADAISVVVNPEGARAAVLDSLARTLDQLRADTLLLVVSLGYPKDAREQLRRSRASFIAARTRELELIMRWLRPNIVVPAVEPYGEGARALGLQPLDFWREYLASAAGAVHRIRPATRVAVSVSSFGPRDSSLYAWAAARGSPVDIVGLSLFPGFDGAATLDTRLRIAQRWIRAAGPAPKDHWVFGTGGFPAVHGERSQEQAIWGVAAWATAQPAVKGMIVVEAGDYTGSRGLRAPDRRVRPAVATIRRVKRALRETARQ